MTLGVYVDTVYRHDPGPPPQTYTNAQIFPFMHFMCEVGSRFGRMVLFGRRDTGGAGADLAMPLAADVVELPHYSNLNRAPEVLRAVPGTIRGMWRGIRDVDVVLVFGPYPFSLFLVVSALVRRKRVVLGVRQDTMKYFRSRLPHRFAKPVLMPIWLIDKAYHRLSRWLPTVVVGDHLEAQYGGPRPNLEALRISLVREQDVKEEPAPLDWSQRIELITVGRVEPEKNPLLLVETMAELERRHPGRFRLRWVGQGRLLDSVRAQARALGLDDVIRFQGYVPFGPELLALYRGSHIFVHVAVTEAFGQVLTEAMSQGTAVVATRVGGVPGAVAGGEAGLLVPPRDKDALAAAIESVVDDPDARTARTLKGLELARDHSLEREAARVALLAAGEGS
ncbi:MAG TPA: glycosyltransferase family 4 protein [Thermoleophilaceae bacterium]|nr:glycosyltransferase family 4 protein [Thermoleophilaceae bacterium]